MKISHQNSTSSDSDPEDKQSSPKRSKKQELSDDDVIKYVSELISTSNKQKTDLLVNNLSQSTILAVVADELNEDKRGQE